MEFNYYETLGDPCSKQNLACASDIKCLIRL